MRHVVITTTLLVFLTFLNLNAQEIKFERLMLGINISYNNASSDLGEYWENPIYIGGMIDYKVSKNFSFITGGLFSFVKVNESKSSAEINTHHLPKLFLFRIPVGLKYYQELYNSISVFLSGGLENNTFAFLGEEADVLGSNDIEHEFGLWGQAGISYKHSNLLTSQLYFNVSNILTSPETIVMNSINYTLYFSFWSE